MRNFARSWVLDLRTRGIRVNVLNLGATAKGSAIGIFPRLLKTVRGVGYLLAA